MIYLVDFKAKFNKGFFFCIGFIIFFTIINFINMKNYYDEMFNQHKIEINNFEEKLKDENKRGEDLEPHKTNDQELENNIEGQSLSEPDKIKLNSLSALLMDGDNNRVLYEVNGFQEMPMEIGRASCRERV